MLGIDLLDFGLQASGFLGSIQCGLKSCTDGTDDLEVDDLADNGGSLLKRYLSKLSKSKYLHLKRPIQLNPMCPSLNLAEQFESNIQSYFLQNLRKIL